MPVDPTKVKVGAKMAAAGASIVGSQSMLPVDLGVTGSECLVAKEEKDLA